MIKKNKFNIIANIICCTVILFMSIGYSSLSKRLSAEEILAQVRIEKDIRVNSITLSEKYEGASSGYINYDHNSIEGTIKLPYAESSLTYTVEVLNISENEYEISSVSGLSEELDYEILDYELEDKICVEDKCSLGITKPIKIKIKHKEGAPIDEEKKYNFRLDFDFQPYKTKTIHITEITNELLSGSATATTPTYDETTANFEVNLVNTASTVEYDIMILNNSKDIKKLTSIETLLNSSGPNVNYEITGINVDDYLAPKEIKVAHIKIFANPESPEADLSTTQLNIRFNFETIDWIPLEIEFLSESDTGDLNIDNAVPFQIRVTNHNPIDAIYEISLDNDKFIVRDAARGNIKYDIKAGETLINTISISVRDDVTYETKTKEIELMLRVLYPTQRDRNVRKITIELPTVFQTTILSSHPIETAPDHYSGIEDTNGYLMRTNELDNLNSIYYFRGVINDNYVRFADNTWRIMRVNYDGNLRLVLNDNVSKDNAQVKVKFSDKYKQIPLDTVEQAIKVVDYRNSVVKKEVENWYAENIAPHEEAKHVVDSKFCVDLSYEGPITTQHQHSVYYFTSYVSVGVDTATYKPQFACKTESILTGKVGLLRAEEIFAAGGFWGVENTKSFLYNQDLPADVPQTSWTLSPSYYSISEQQAGVITFNQHVTQDNGGSIFDWTYGGNPGEYYGFRPVITIDGNVKINGTGTKDDPYYIVEN